MSKSFMYVCFMFIGMLQHLFFVQLGALSPWLRIANNFGGMCWLIRLDPRRPVQTLGFKSLAWMAMVNSEFLSVCSRDTNVSNNLQVQRDAMI